MNLFTEEQQNQIEDATEYSCISPFSRPTDHINSLLLIIQLQQQVIDEAVEQRDRYIPRGPLQNFGGTKYNCDLKLKKIMRGNE